MDRSRQLPWVTIVLAVANVAAFGWELSQGADPMAPTAPWMIEHGGNLGSMTLDGEPWRLVTSMFLHFGVLHIAMNMVGLFGGRQVERMYGPLGFAAIYLVSGLAGGLATSLRGNVVSAGASGAIFGVFGAFGAFLYLHRDRLDKEQVKNQARGLASFLALNLVLGLSATGIDLVAHVGGLVAGFVVGIALEAGTSEAPSTLRRSLLVGVLGAAVLFGVAFAIPRPHNALYELGKSEEKVLARWNEVVGKIQAETITDDQVADAIEREVLPQWRQIHQTYVDNAEGEHRRLMLDYLEAREQGWETLVRGLRAKNDAQIKQGMERFQQADAIIAKLNAQN